MIMIRILNIPDSTVVALRERADAYGHAGQQEPRETVEVVAMKRVSGHTPRPIELVTTSTSTSTTWHREETYGDDGR